MSRSRFIASVAAALVAGIVLGGVGISVGLTGAPTTEARYASAGHAISEPTEASHVASGTPSVPTTMTPGPGHSGSVRPSGPSPVNHALCDSNGYCVDPVHDCQDTVSPTKTQTQVRTQTQTQSHDAGASTGGMHDDVSHDAGASTGGMHDDVGHDAGASTGGMHDGSSDGSGHMSGGDHDGGHM